MPEENQNNSPFIIPPENLEEQPEKKTLWDRFEFRRSWLLATVAIVAVLVVIFAWSIVSPRGSRGEPKVRLWIDTSQTITSGSASEFFIIYENSEQTSLHDATLEIIYPQSFRYLGSVPDSSDGSGRQFYLGDVPPFGSGKLAITGIFSGSPEESQLLRSRLFFQQAGITASFSKGADVEIALQAPDFNLSISAPSQVVSGQRIDYSIGFQNISDTDLERVQIRLVYPADFEVLSSDPEPLEPAQWEVGRMKIGDQALVALSGILSGPAGEDRTIQADVGYLDDAGTFVLQSRAFASTKILTSPLTVSSQLISPTSVNEGDSLRYLITYRNAGSVGQNNVKIVMHLEENAADLTTLQASGGALVGRDVIWNPSGVSGLRILPPAAEGTLILNFSIKRNLSSGGARNPAVRTRISVSSLELPEPVEGEATLVKVKTQLKLSAGQEHVSGPLPPKVGETTVYRVRLKVENLFNQLNGTAFSAVLNTPTVDVVDGSVNPISAEGNFNFSPASGRVTWNIGSLDAYSQSAMDFLVKVTPSDADRVTGLVLLKSMLASGIDEFTGEHVTSQTLHELSIGF